MLVNLGALAATGASVYELTLAMARMQRRRDVFARAQARAMAISRPLVVVGNPDGGMHTRITRGYTCGDICVDLTGCPACPVSIQADITKGHIPEVADDAAVVFCSCVLELVGDVAAAEREFLRMAGSPANVFCVYVDPGSVTSVVYPGARQRATRDGWKPVTREQKVISYGAMALGALAIGVVATRRLRR